MMIIAIAMTASVQAISRSVFIASLADRYHLGANGRGDLLPRAIGSVGRNANPHCQREAEPVSQRKGGRAGCRPEGACLLGQSLVRRGHGIWQRAEHRPDLMERCAEVDEMAHHLSLVEGLPEACAACSRSRPN